MFLDIAAFNTTIVDLFLPHREPDIRFSGTMETVLPTLHINFIILLIPEFEKSNYQNMDNFYTVSINVLEIHMHLTIYNYQKSWQHCDEGSPNIEFPTRTTEIFRRLSAVGIPKVK